MQFGACVAGEQEQVLQQRHLRGENRPPGYESVTGEGPGRTEPRPPPFQSRSVIPLNLILSSRCLTDNGARAQWPEWRRMPTSTSLKCDDASMTLEVGRTASVQLGHGVVPDLARDRAVLALHGVGNMERPRIGRSANLRRRSRARTRAPCDPVRVVWLRPEWPLRYDTLASWEWRPGPPVDILRPMVRFFRVSGGAASYHRRVHQYFPGSKETATS